MTNSAGTRDTGGGRESREPEEPEGPYNLDNSPGLALEPAAANPAACPIGFLRCESTAHDERIRELEAEVERQIRRWIASDKALKSLGKALGERAQQLSDAEATLEDERKTSAYQYGRAEKAEARVTELEAWIDQLRRMPESQMSFDPDCEPPEREGGV